MSRETRGRLSRRGVARLAQENEEPQEQKDPENQSGRAGRLKKRSEQEERELQLDEQLRANGVDIDGMPMEEKLQLAEIMQVSKDDYQKEENVRDMFREQKQTIQRKQDLSSEDRESPLIQIPESSESDNDEVDNTDNQKKASVQETGSTRSVNTQEKAGSAPEVSNKCSGMNRGRRTRQAKQCDLKKNDEKKSVDKPAEALIVDSDDDGDYDNEEVNDMLSSPVISKGKHKASKSRNDAKSVDSNEDEEEEAVKSDKAPCLRTKTKWDPEPKPVSRRGRRLGLSRGGRKQMPESVETAAESMPEPSPVLRGRSRGAESGAPSAETTVEMPSSSGMAKSREVDPEELLDLTQQDDSRDDMETSLNEPDKGESGDETDDMETDVSQILETDAECDTSAVFLAKKPATSPGPKNKVEAEVTVVTDDEVAPPIDTEETQDPNASMGSSPDLFGSNPIVPMSPANEAPPDDDETQDMSPLQISPVATSTQDGRMSFQFGAVSASVPKMPGSQSLDSDGSDEEVSLLSDKNEEASLLSDNKILLDVPSSPVFNKNKTPEEQHNGNVMNNHGSKTKIEENHGVNEPQMGSSSVTANAKSDESPVDDKGGKDDTENGHQSKKVLDEEEGSIGIRPVAQTPKKRFQLYEEIPEDDQLPSPAKRRKLSHRKPLEKYPLFSPPGVDPAKYTQRIIAYFERHRQALLEVQSRLPCQIPWGQPVQVGTHMKGTLDLKGSPESQDLQTRSGRPRRSVQRAKSASPIPSQSKGRSLRSTKQAVMQSYTQTISDDEDFEIAMDVIPKRSFYGNKSVTKSRMVKLTDDNLPDLVEHSTPKSNANVESNGEDDWLNVASVKKGKAVKTYTRAKPKRQGRNAQTMKDTEANFEIGDLDLNDMNETQSYGAESVTGAEEDAPLRLTGEPTLEADLDSIPSNQGHPDYFTEDEDGGSDTDVSGFIPARSVRNRPPTPALTKRAQKVLGESVESDVLCRTFESPERQHLGLFESYRDDPSPAPDRSNSKAVTLKGGKHNSISSLDNGDLVMASGSFQLNLSHDCEAAVEPREDSPPRLLLSPEITEDESVQEPDDEMVHKRNLSQDEVAHKNDSSQDEVALKKNSSHDEEGHEKNSSQDERVQEKNSSPGVMRRRNDSSPVADAGRQTRVGRNRDGEHHREELDNLDLVKLDEGQEKDEEQVDSAEAADDLEQTAAQDPAEQPVGVQCPICSRYFADAEIEQHANACIEAMAAGEILQADNENNGQLQGRNDDIQVDEVEATGVQPGGVGLEQPAEPIRRVRKRLGQAREEQNQMEEPTAAQPIRRERRRLGRAREETQQEPVAKQSNDKDMRGLVRDREDEQQVEEPVPVQPIRREKRKLGHLAVGDTEPEEGASKKTKVAEPTQDCFVCNAQIPSSQFEEHVIACVDRMERGISPVKSEPRVMRSRTATPVEEQNSSGGEEENPLPGTSKQRGRKPVGDRNSSGEEEENQDLHTTKRRGRKVTGKATTRTVELQVSDDDLEILENQPIDADRRVTYLQKMKQTKGRTLKLLEVKKELQLSSAPKCGRKEPLCASERLPIEKLLASSSETSSGEISEFSEPESPPDQPATKPASFSLPFKPISSQTEGGLDYMNQFKKKGGKQSSTTRAPAKKAGTKRKRKTKRKAPRKKAATEKAKAKNNKAVVHIR